MIHKTLVGGIPKYRPITSQIASATNNIAKYLLDFIPFFTKNKYTIKDSVEVLSMVDK